MLNVNISILHLKVICLLNVDFIIVSNCLINMRGTIIVEGTRVAQSVQCLATDWMTR